jgi:hypothetical protein
MREERIVGMWDISLLYVGVVVVIVAIGFVFALRMGMAAALEADRRWATQEPETRAPAIEGVPIAAHAERGE